MLLRGIIYSSLLIGLLVGLLLTGMQSVVVNPIIFASEAYETEEVAPVAAAPHAHDHGAHEHNDEAWAPADGAERLFYTALANVIASIGFAAVLLALMSQTQLQGWTSSSLGKGVLWGLAGFIAFFAAPGIGLPPEIPGIEAAPLDNRQGWWALTVVMFVVGMGLLAFAPLKLKAVSLVFFALPYVIGAPHGAGPEFTGDAASVAALTDLHSTFIMASGITNLVFWLVLGAFSAWCVNRWVLKGASGHAVAHG
ncbi:MAG: CbtA family protein [Pseudomonadales bacterium]